MGREGELREASSIFSLDLLHHRPFLETVSLAFSKMKRNDNRDENTLSDRASFVPSDREFISSCELLNKFCEATWKRKLSICSEILRSISV